MEKQILNEVITLWNFKADKFFEIDECFTGEKKIGIAVGVCTYNRGESLLRFLNSLVNQVRYLDEIIIIDASETNSTEKKLKDWLFLRNLQVTIIYYRVGDSLRGLTKQRNFLVKKVSRTWLFFFDDDIEVQENCFKIIHGTIFSLPEEIIGVGCRIKNEIFDKIPFRWKLRFFLRLAKLSDAGNYLEFGMAVPSNLIPDFFGVRQVDILSGGATGWKTKIFDSICFDENLQGYGLGEDLEFSLQTKNIGKKIIIGNAYVLHLHDPSSRISSFRYGLQSVRHYKYFADKFGIKNFKNSLQFYSWQFVDILLYIAISVIKLDFNLLRMSIGRLIGIIFKIDTLADR